MREVLTDIPEDTVTMTFDDAKGTLEEAPRAIHDPGYTVGEPVRLR